MRHGRRNVRLSRRSEHRQAMLDNMACNLLLHGRIRTTVAKAKETKRLADRLISFGKEGSIHSRRQAYQVLQDRGLVKRLFAEVAPRFLDCQGGYTRVLRLAPRAGDGAELALLELTRLPVEPPKKSPKVKAERIAPPAKEADAPPAKKEHGEEPQKPKKFFEGIRELFRPKKGSS